MVVLIELLPYAIALLCLALAAVITVIVIAFLGWLIDLLNQIPKVNIGTGFLHTVEQSVTHALGVAFAWVNKTVGASFHGLARLTEELWHELRANALAFAQAIPLIGLIATILAGVRELVHHLHLRTTTQSAQVKTLERELHGIEHQVKTLEREYKGIDQVAVNKRLGQIDKELATIETQTIPAIRQAESDAASAIGNLYDWAKGKASLLGVGTFATAVAAVIGLDALNALRCPSFLKSFGNRGCGLFNGIEDMLGLFVDLFIITDLCEVIPLIEATYKEIGAPAIGLLTEAIDAMPCVAGNEPAPLTPPKLYLPANPRVALSLP